MHATAPHNGNLLLAALPPAELAQLEPMLEAVHVSLGEVLVDRARPVRYVYFPDDAVISLMAVADGRATLEVSLVGREGVVGAADALGQGVAPVRAVVQREGFLCRMDALQFRAGLIQHPALQRMLFRYADAQLAQAIQIAVCTRFHVLEARLARSLLVTRDRLGSDSFHLTHEFLAHTLGVRRVGVTKAARTLQLQGLIRYSRGNIHILDGPGLAAASCPCYAIVKGAEEGVLNGAASSSGYQ